MLPNRPLHLSLAAALITAMAVPAAPAEAANIVQCWKVVFSRPCVELIVGDTEAGLPTAGVPEGASAWATDSGRLVCFSGSAWGPCNDTGGGGLASTDLDTSSELRAMVTDETGSGSLMFGLTAAMQDDLGCTADQGFRRDSGDTAWECFTPGSGSGTLTSAAMTVPTGFTLSGSPITTSGTFALELSNQTANTVWAGPTTGSAAAPGFRALVSADIPNNAANTTGTASDLSGCSDCLGGSEIDEASLVLSSLPPYQQYDPARPPSTCAQCDEFTNGVTFSFSWQNQESSTATAERDGLTLSHPGDATGIAAYYLTGPDGSATDWMMHTRLSTANQSNTNQGGLILVATGTAASPTLMYLVIVFNSTASASNVGVRSMTSYTSAQTTVGTDFTAPRSGYLGIGYVSSTKRLSFYFSDDGYNYRALAGVTLAAHPTTSMGLTTAALAASFASSVHFHFLRIRTDASRLEVGE